MGTEITISLSLIFSTISMIGVVANMVILFKRESELSKQKEVQTEKHFATIDVTLENITNRINDIVLDNHNISSKIDKNSEDISNSNERIGTLFRLHDDNKRRVERLEERTNKM